MPAPAGVEPSSFHHPPPQAHPHQWASDPPRSPLDLLASLPQISDMFAAPHSSHHQQGHGHHGGGLHSPVMTPRTQNWFESHFPDLGSPDPTSHHHHHHQQPHQLPTPVSAKPTAASNPASLRFPVDGGLGSAGYWMSGGGFAQAGEREGGMEEGGPGREPLRLKHFGPLYVVVGGRLL